MKATKVSSSNPNEPSDTNHTPEGKPEKKPRRDQKRCAKVNKRTKRWGKLEDKKMFDLLNQAVKDHNIPLKDIKLPESLNISSHYDVLLNLKREM